MFKPDRRKRPDPAEGAAALAEAEAEIISNLERLAALRAIPAEEVLRECATALAGPGWRGTGTTIGEVVEYELWIYSRSKAQEGAATG